MSPDLERLITLQQFDDALIEARRIIAAYPQRIADADAKLDEATARVDAVKAKLKDSQEARRASEKDAAVYQGRLGKFKEQLLAVKTNREYQAIQHEIATAQEELGTVEERVLERMMEADVISAELKDAEVALAARKTEIAKDKAALERESAAEQQKLAETSQARATLVAEIEPRLVSLYEQVAKVRKGVALSLATREGLCTLCHVRLRPQVFQLIRQNDSIVQCDSCQRIMYYRPPAAAVAPAVAPA